MIRLLSISLFIFYLIAGPAGPGEGYAQDFQISQVMVHQEEDSLTVGFSLDNFFTGKFLRTLQSGITLQTEVQVNLLDQQDKTVAERLLAGRVGYDVWEQMYLLEGMGGPFQRFSSLPELKEKFSTINNLCLWDINNLMPAVSYRCRVRVKVILLNREQSEKLKWWLQGSDPTEEDSPSQERSTGFKLNINQLVQLFFNRDDNPEEYTREETTRLFRMEDLPLP